MVLEKLRTKKDLPHNTLFDKLSITSDQVTDPSKKNRQFHKLLDLNNQKDPGLDIAPNFTNEMQAESSKKISTYTIRTHSPKYFQFYSAVSCAQVTGRRLRRLITHMRRTGA